jgi:GntR family transcriptional regulator
MSPSTKNPLDSVSPMVTQSGSLEGRLADRIRQMIVDGLYSTGSKLPTEEELAHHFRVGRTTVREALKRLEAEDLIKVRRGQGRYVSNTPPLRQPITRLESVTGLLASHGYDVTNRILSSERRPASEEEAKELQLEVGEEVFHLERLRLYGDEPLIYSIDVVPLRFLAGLVVESWNGSLYDELGAVGMEPMSAVTTLKAVTLPPKIEKKYGLDKRYPWLLMVQLNLSLDGTPVIYSHDYHRGDRFTFDVLRRVEQ